MIKNIAAGVAGLGLSTLASTAFAVACTGGLGGATGDVEYNGNSANACFTSTADTLLGSGALGGFGNFTQAVVANSTSATTGPTVNFFTYTLDLGSLDDDGSFKLKATDQNGAAVPNLPTTLDIVIGLLASAELKDKGYDKDGNKVVYDTAYFLFNNATISATSVNGEYEIDFGSGYKSGDLKAMAIYVSTPPTAVPAPASLALLGLALAGMGFARRRAQ